MGIFTKKRKDGTLVKDVDPLIRIMPYIMRGRNESCVYYRNSVRLTPIKEFIQEKRKQGERITLFNVIVSSLMQVLVLRPHLNRFIAGRRLYDHKTYEILYNVKIDMSDDANESVARVQMSEDDSIYEIADKMKEQIEVIKTGQVEKWDDKLIRYFSRSPRWFLRSLLNILRWLDFHGILPNFLINTIPMYSSIFISHIGSIGGNSPFHHLYEFGTTSIFITIGKTYEKPFKAADGGIEWHEMIDLGITVDERICDGYYLIKSLTILDQLLDNPRLMELTPKEIKAMQKDGRLKFGRNRLQWVDSKKEAADEE